MASFRSRIAALISGETKSAVVNAPQPGMYDRMMAGEMYATLSAASPPPENDLARIAIAEQHPIVMSCVRKIGWAAASVPFGREVDNGDVVFDDIFGQRLAEPGSAGGKSALLMKIAMNMAVCGRAYIYGQPSAFRGEPPKRLAYLRSDRLTRIPNPDGTVNHWLYNNGQMGACTLPPSHVCEIRQPWLTDNLNQTSDFLDASAYSNLTAAWRPATLFQGLADLVRKILDNNGGLPGILAWSGENGEPMGVEHQKQLKTYFERFRTGGDKFGEIAFIDAAGGKVDWIKITAELGDLNAIENKNSAILEICAVFGVPNLLLGFGGDATYANQAEARRYFWTDTIMPGYVEPIADALSHWLNVKIKPDYSEVPALADYRMSLSTSIATMNYLTINEKRKLLSYPSVMGGDIVMTTPAEIPLNRLLDTNGNNLSDEVDGWVYNQEMIRQYLQGRRDSPTDDHGALNGQHRTVTREVANRTAARIADRTTAQKHMRIAESLLEMAA